MGEPLIGKLYSFHELEDWINETEEDFEKNATLKVLFRKEEIESAVEWLKEEIEKNDFLEKDDLEYVFGKIILAFPDLNTHNSKKENKEVKDEK